MFDEDLVDSALLDELLAPPQPPLTQAAPATESELPAAKPKAPRKRAKPASSPRRLPPAVPSTDDPFFSDLHILARKKAEEVQDALVSGDAVVERIVITVTRTTRNVMYSFIY